MKIRTATAKDKQQWNAYVLNHPEGLAYHQFAWKEAVESAYGFKGQYLIAENQGSVCGVLPLIEFTDLFKRRCLVSLPYCDVGGVLAHSPAIGARLIAEAKQTGLKIGASTIELRFGSDPEWVTDKLHLNKVRMVLDLPGDSKTLMAHLKAKVRSQVNKPVRDGLVAILGGVELIDDFYRVFSINMRDLGSPVHSKNWVRAVLKAYGAYAKVGLVHTPKGEPAAAGIVLLHSGTVSIPWASSLKRFNSLNPNMLLYWTFLSFAADNGYRQFDFGRSTPDEGTYRFKKQWGARPKALGWCRVGSNPDNRSGSEARGSSRKVLESIWQWMPLSVANALGPRLRKYIDR